LEKGRKPGLDIRKLGIRAPWLVLETRLLEVKLKYKHGVNESSGVIDAFFIEISYRKESLPFYRKLHNYNRQCAG